MFSSSYSILELLTTAETSLLGKLIIQVKGLEHLNSTLTQILDPSLIPHCRVGCYEKGILTLYASSAAFATKLRYQIPILLSNLRTFEEWAGLCSIQIRIQPYFPSSSQESSSPATPGPYTLTQNSAEQILSLAKALKGQPGNEALVASLERLAKHGK